jgi:hypothetical protein
MPFGLRPATAMHMDEHMPDELLADVIAGVALGLLGRLAGVRTLERHSSWTCSGSWPGTGLRRRNWK